MFQLAAGRPARHLFDVVLLLVQRDFKGKYKHTQVGLLWSVVSPVLFLLIFYLLFRLVLNFNIPKYATFAFTGILAWAWFQSSVIQAVNSITSNPGLVNQPGFPVAALPIIAVTSNLLTFLISFPLLIVVLIMEGGSPSAALLGVPPLIALQFVLTLGVSYVLAALNVAFRDVEHGLPILLQLGYYLTPIFYDAGQVPERYRFFFEINPLFHLIEGYRSILLRGELPNPGPLLVIAAGSAVLLWAGCRYFEQARYRFLEEL